MNVSLFCVVVYILRASAESFCSHFSVCVCVCACVQLRAQRSMSRTCVQIYPIIVCIYLLRRIHVQHIHKYKYIHSNTHLQLAIHPCKNVRLHIFMASLPFYNSNDIVFFFFSLLLLCLILIYFFLLHSILLFKWNSTHFFYCSRHDKAHEKWCGEQHIHKNRNVYCVTSTSTNQHVTPPACFLAASVLTCIQSNDISCTDFELWPLCIRIYVCWGGRLSLLEVEKKEE